MGFFTHQKKEVVLKVQRISERYPSTPTVSYQIQFKSHMESVTYHWIKLLIKHYPKYFYSVQYEPERFHFKPNGYGVYSYVPDFKVITCKGIYYIENKGYMDFTDRVKIKLLHRDYPWIKLRVVGPKQMNWVKKRIKELENTVI